MIFFGDERCAARPVADGRESRRVTTPTARVALADDGAAGRAGRPGDRRRWAQPAVHATTSTSRALARAGGRGRRAPSSTWPPAPRSVWPSSPCWPASSASPGGCSSTCRVAWSPVEPEPSCPRLALRRAPCPPSSAGRAEAAFEATAASTARSSTAPSTASPSVVRGGGNGLRVAPDRLRAQLRAGRRRRRGRPPRLLPHASRPSDAALDPRQRERPRRRVLAAHRARSWCPPSARWWWRLSPAPARAPSSRRARCSPSGTRRHHRVDARRLRGPRRRLPVRGQPHLDRGPRHLVAPRRRRHLAVPGRADRVAVPAGDLRRHPAPRPEALLRVAAGAAGRVHGRVLRPRPVPLLRVLRDRARADVLPHRRMGPRRAGLRGDEVLPLHDVRLGLDAGRDRCAGLPPPGRVARRQPGQGGRGASRGPGPDRRGGERSRGPRPERPGQPGRVRRAVRPDRRHQRRQGRPGGRAGRPEAHFDLVTIAESQTSPTRRRAQTPGLGCGPLDLPRVRRRVRGEGAAVPAAHLAARRPHRGADGGLGDPGRRHAEAGHVRLPALRPLPVPRGRGVLRARCWSPSG